MEWLLTGVILATLYILGSTRLTACIRAVAVQGILLSVFPLLARGSLLDVHGLGLFVGTFSIKGVLIPWLLFRSIREVTIRQEVEPTVSRHLSLLVGGLAVLLAFWGGAGLGGVQTPLIVPTALAMVLLGFLLLITRVKAVTQVIGFLVLENGVFLFGMTLVADFPITVEMGVLLDLLVGVFVMGIMVHHIHRTFDQISAPPSLPPRVSS